MPDTSARPEANWRYSAILSGFVGTVAAGLALLIAYALAVALARVLPGQIGGWFDALTQNPTTQMVTDRLALALLLHFGVGIALGLVYAAFVEPRLEGPGWRRGLVFSLIPWVLSLVFFLPLVGGGLFGLGLGAGPLPILGNLILHLVYGAVLGWVYARSAVELARTDPASVAANVGAERGVAFGVVGGTLAGAVLGYLAGAVWDGVGSVQLAMLVGATLGATFGGFVGSYFGLNRAEV
ncbi:MAG TPA: DUF6789 family protein [Chloroflexota bacterium]|jgi:hypothetical protein|nr:DUF6789 family protein [Chloroflexota bacterium]